MLNAPERRLTVLFVLHSLSGGGAERVVVHLVNSIDRRRFAPVLALGAAEGPFRSNLRADVGVHVTGAVRARAAGPALLRTVWRLRPNVVFSTAGLNLAVSATRRGYPPGTRVILREASSPKAFLNDVARASPRRARFYELAYRALYRQADAVICQSDAMLADMVDLGVPRGRLVRIYNPVAMDRVQALARRPADTFVGDGPRLVSVGRLSYAKGYDVLLEATAILLRHHPNLTLIVFGEGEERSALESAARRLGINNAVSFPGFVSNPYPAVLAADLFVSSSRYEGFSNAIVEALACGTPVVATDCPSANREVIQIGTDGWLCPAPGDAAALARTIAWGLAARRQLDSEVIRQRCSARFASTRVVAMYESVLAGPAKALPVT